MENMYFKLSDSISFKVSGCAFPQLRDFKKGYDGFGEKGIYKMKSFKLPDFKPNLDGPMLYKKAKLTDHLSSGMIEGGWFVNDKIKDIFSNFNIVNHKYYPAVIYTHTGEPIYDYYALITEFDINHYVDFQKMVFSIKETNHYNEVLAVTVKNGDDYLRLEKEVRNMAEDDTRFVLGTKNPIFLHKELIGDLDFFYTYRYGYNEIISERLKNALVDAKVTGWDYFPLKESEVRFV